MYILITLFFASLIGITFMIGRKLLLIQHGETVNKGETLFQTPYFFEEWKHLAAKNVKMYGYAGIVGSIRLYFRLSNFLKNKYQEVKIKLENISRKKQNGEPVEKREVSKFLKMVSEYKNKVRKIKERVKEEESL